MWLDAMVLFPVILLGIEKIINKGKPTLYCVSLALMFFANYYMAYMICIFAVLYFLTYYFANYSIEQKFNRALSKKAPLSKRLSNSLFWSSGVKFAFYSIVAVLLAAFVVIPLITILTDSSATSSGSPAEYKKYFNTFDFRESSCKLRAYNQKQRHRRFAECLLRRAYSAFGSAVFVLQKNQSARKDFIRLPFGCALFKL